MRLREKLQFRTKFMTFYNPYAETGNHYFFENRTNLLTLADTMLI